jgi:hypothetical protein
MKIPQHNHIEFYEWQINVLEENWDLYANTSMKILIQEKRLFVGRIWGIQEQQGNVVLRFKSTSVPRMKQPYILCLVGSEAPINSENWNFTYSEFRTSRSLKLSGLNSEISTINYLKSEEEEWSYILIKGFDVELLELIKDKYLSKKKHPLIVIAETDPPLDYFFKLKEYLTNTPGDIINNLSLNVEESLWFPSKLDNRHSGFTEDLIKIIEQEKVTIIQGPPGTGKSYLAAEICNYFLKIGKSICVTALTNKALMEIAEKKGFEEPIASNIVFKTNLSNDEAKLLPGINPSGNFSPKQGELLLSSFYKLSQKQSEIIAGSHRFDLMIIEEASQAYLATIAMFSSIASKLLIIGDHKQLSPVVIRPHEAAEIHHKINGIINGLETFTFNNSNNSYKLTYTRRLTSDAAKLTGVYYNEELNSISKYEGDIKINTNYKDFFHKNGGISIVKLPLAMASFTEKDLIKFICNIANEILKKNSSLDVAILAPYARIESMLYDQYSRLSTDYSRLTMNTIHKIQGLTCDLAILILPLENPSFELKDNLFNVGTSRAKLGTLIITYTQISLITNCSTETRKFIDGCLDVSEIFMKSFILDKKKP